jgi:hypothetical protein
MTATAPAPRLHAVFHGLIDRPVVDRHTEALTWQHLRSHEVL